MSNEAQRSWESLNTLVCGLAEAGLSQGGHFTYDGAHLRADELGDILLPSIICLAQNVSRCVGMGEFGYVCKLDESAAAVFKLVATPSGKLAPFHLIAPFVVEAFDKFVLECRADISRVFEAAAQTIHPGFTLERSARMEGESTSLATTQQGLRI